MRTPMPSPRGTNLERLFIDRRPAAAYDAARRASDEVSSLPNNALTVTDDTLNALLNFLTDRLPEDDLEKAIRILKGDAAEDPVMSSDAQRLGRARDGFARRNPDAAKIRIV